MLLKLKKCRIGMDRFSREGDQRMTQDLSFSDFMKYLVAIFHDRNIPMPLKDERPWHKLFYTIRSADLGPATPSFLKELRFDWDGPYPKCQEVSEFLHALHWNAGVSAINPHYTTITLPKEIASLWGKRRDALNLDVLRALESVVEKVQDEFVPC